VGGRENTDADAAAYPVLFKLSSGALAGLCAQFITYPGDTVRRRMIANGVGGTERKYRNAVDCTL